MSNKEETIVEKLLLNDNSQKIVAIFTLLYSSKKALYIDELIECSKISDEKIRQGAIMVLAKIRSKKVIPILKKALKDNCEGTRIIAALGLAGQKENSAIPTLKLVIKNDNKDHSTHKLAIEALGFYQSEKLLPTLAVAIKHRRKASRKMAIAAISKIGTKKAFEILKKAMTQERNPELQSKISTMVNMMQRQLKY